MKNIIKLLNRPIGYSLLTASNKFGFSKIALKRNIFKNNYKLIYFNEDVNAIETKNVLLDLSSLDENIITIKKIGTFKLQDVKYILTNPKEIVENESEIFRQIDRNAREKANSYIDYEDTAEYNQVFNVSILQQ